MTIDELLNYFSLTVIDDLDLNSIRANDLFSVSDKEGYKYKASIKFLRDAVKRNGNLAKFHKLNPYSLENIHNWIKVNNIPIKIVSQEYKGIKEKMIWECSICGEHYERSFGKILNGGNSTYYCLKCSTKKRTLERSYSTKEREDFNVTMSPKKDVEKIISDMGYVLLSEYKTSRDKLDLQDMEGYKYSTTFDNLTHKNRMLKFSKSNKYTIENIKTYIKNNNLDCELLSNEFKTMRDRLEFKCACGKTFSTTLTMFTSKFTPKTKCNDCTKGQSSIESAVENYLIDNNIEFEKQKTFTELLSNNGISLRYDFYIPCKNILIEVDGRQHFEMATFGGISKERAIEKFKTVKQYDEMKNKYAEEHNIKLIRLWYKDFYVSKNYINILNKELIEMK